MLRSLLKTELKTLCALMCLAVGLGACSTPTRRLRQQPVVSVVVTSSTVIQPTTSVTSVPVSSSSSPISPTSTAATTTTTTPDMGEHAIRTIVYDAGMQQLPGAAGTRRWWGVVSAPSDGLGPFPVAVVLHGAHSFCSGASGTRAWPCPEGTEIPNHEGLAYLTDALARRGFVAIAPGLNAEYALDREGGVPGTITAAIVERDLRALQTGQPAFGINPSMVDPSRLVLVGHSRGGSIAAVLARPDSTLSAAYPTRGVVLLAPSPDTVEPDRLADVAAVVVVGTCDGDTGVTAANFATAALVAKRQTPVGLVIMDGATHNAINDRLAPEEVLDGRPGCGDGDRLTPSAQRELLAASVPELARRVLGSPAAGIGAAVFDPMRADDTGSPRISVVHIDPSSARRSLLPDLTSPGAGDALSKGLATTWCPAGTYSSYSRPGTERCHRVELDDLVGTPAALAMSWDQPGASLTAPGGVEAPGAILVVRAFADPIDERMGPGPVILQLSGRRPDASIWTAQITVPVAALGAPFPPFGARRGAVLWTEQRLALDTPLTAVTVTVMSPAQGSLQLVSLEAVRLP